MTRNARVGAGVSILWATLLLVSALPVSPVAAQNASDEYVIRDRTGDGGFSFVGTSPAQYPPNAATDPTDIEWLSIQDEDELGLTFRLKVVDLMGLGNPFDIFSGGNNHRYYFHSKLEGTNIEYELAWFPRFPAPGEQAHGVEPVSARFCLLVGGDEDRGGSGECAHQKVSGRVHWDDDVLSADVSKDAILGRDPLPGSGRDATPRGLPQELLKGQQLGAVWATAQGTFPTFFSDRLPDTGNAPRNYVFQTDAANGRIRLALAASNATAEATPSDYGYPGGPPGSGGSSKPKDSGGVGVVPGVPTLVPLRVENHNAGKRLINLTTRIDDKTPGLATKWSFQIVPTIAVPSGDDRVINLIVDASSSVRHRETVNVTVLGRSLGFPSELAAIRIQLVASVPPGPDANVLHFHGTGMESGTAGRTICTTMVTFFCEVDTWLNTLEPDPTSTMETGIVMDQSYSGNSGESFALRFDLDTPLATDLFLDVDEPIDATLAVTSPISSTGTVTLEVLAGHRLVGTASLTGEFKPDSKFTLTFLPLVDAKHILATEGLVARVLADVPLGQGGAAGLTGLTFVPKDSRLELPLVRDPNAVAFGALPLGPAFVTLHALSDLEEFLNPGRTKIFNATVTNEGVQVDNVTLQPIVDLDGKAPGWTVSIKPGNKFRLNPGESAKVGVLIHAPFGAKEGDQFPVVLNASSGIDARAFTQLRYTAVITTNLDIPDEAGGYVVDPESASKLDVPAGKGTPGLPAGLLALTLLAGAAFLRRRRAE